jgi:hypothetical protein
VDGAIAVVRRLGAGEASVHRITIDIVHFQAVGAVYGISDIVCAVAGFKRVGIDRLYSSALLFGSGTIRAAHGMVPLPAPATVAIARGFPSRRIDAGVELTTPTGAALITELAEYSPGLDMKVDKIGYGAGTRDDQDRPNLLRLIVGTDFESQERDQISVIETNIDDCTAEEIGYLLELLMREGALDAFVTPVQMKKNRPGFLVTVLAQESTTEKLAGLLLRDSSTAGVRFRREQRRKLKRDLREVKTRYGNVRIKFLFGGDVRKFSPEYDDVARIATEAGVPFSRVYQAALRAMEEMEGERT